MKTHELNELIKTGEGYHLEFKESLDKTFVEEACAFANSSGGKIVMGVSDEGEITGIKTTNSFRSRIQDILKQLEPMLVVDLLIVDNAIVIDVPEGKEKPYGCSKGFFVRIGPNSQKLTKYDIPEHALREAVVNAVCHRDYFNKSANVMIEVFDDRVEISNPGGLPSGLNPEDFGTKSVVRNPIIASLLNRANYIERIGTGINRIKDAVKRNNKVKY